MLLLLLSLLLLLLLLVLVLVLFLFLTVVQEKWTKSQTKAQKSSKDDFIWEIW